MCKVLCTATRRACAIFASPIYPPRTFFQTSLAPTMTMQVLEANARTMHHVALTCRYSIPRSPKTDIKIWNRCTLDF